MVDLQEIIQTIESMEDAVHLSLVAEAIDVAKRRKRRIAGSVFQEGDTVWVIQKTKRSKGVINKMNYSKSLNGRWALQRSNCECSVYYVRIKG